MELLALKTLANACKMVTKRSSAPFPFAFSEHPCEPWWIPAACPGWREVCIHLGTALVAPHVAKAA